MKYKLVKCYPGSPRLGSITSKGGLDNTYTYYGCYSLPINPEEYPEFWEKVVEKEQEKEWEILSLRGKNSQYVTTYKQVYDEYGLYKDNDEFVRYYLESKAWEIYSVKRLSDEEVFTVGDGVKATWMFRNDANIQRFSIGTNGKMGVIIETTGFPLDEAIKVPKKKIDYTTEDGVGMSFGDVVYWTIKHVSDGQLNYLYPLSLHKNHVESRGCLFDKSMYKVFSTEEAAKEYVEKANRKVTVELSTRQYEKLLKLLED